MMKTLSLLLLTLMVSPSAHSAIGLTLPECVQLYGPERGTAKYNKELRWFLSPHGALAGVHVYARFDSEGLAVQVTYLTSEAPLSAKFQESFAKIRSINAPDITNPFVDIGITRDHVERLWATANRNAFMLVMERGFMVSVYTKAGLKSRGNEYEEMLEKWIADRPQNNP